MTDTDEVVQLRSYTGERRGLRLWGRCVDGLWTGYAVDGTNSVVWIDPVGRRASRGSVQTVFSNWCKSTYDKAVAGHERAAARRSEPNGTGPAIRELVAARRTEAGETLEELRRIRVAIELLAEALS
jgi:hypothetical protein